MPLVIIPLITEIIKLINLILEGTPVEQRRANSMAWYFATWPVLKGLLSLLKVPPEAIAQIEEQMKGVQV